MDDDGWEIYNDQRKQKRKQKRDEYKQYPHLVRLQKANQLQQKLNIDNLASTLLGEEAHELQISGWRYRRVLRPNDDLPQDQAMEYTTIDNINKWGDKILFCKEKI